MDSTTALGNNSNQTCSPPISIVGTAVALLVTLCISAVILLLLTFLKKRVRLAPNCCDGHPGIPSPMDFLITPRHRWIYVAILAVMGVTAYNTFNLVDTFGVPNVYLKLFVKLVALPLLVIAVMVLQFGPLFACVDSPLKLLGHIIGLFYSLLWYVVAVLTYRIGVYLQLTTSCNGGFTSVSSETFAIVFLRDLPYLIVSGLIVIWYLYQVIVGTIKCVQGAGDDVSSYVKNPRFLDTCRDYHIRRVKDLLKKHEIVPPKLYKKVLFYLIPFDKNYKLPVPFLGAVCAVLLLLYNFSFGLSSGGIVAASQLGSLYRSLLLPALTANSTFTRNDFVAPYIPLATDILRAVFVGVPVLLVLAPCLAFISCLLLLWHMLGSVSKIMKKALREGFEHDGSVLSGPLRRLPGSWKFVGNLIGYSVVAYILYYLIFLLVGAVIGAFIILVRIRQPTYLRDLIANIMVNTFLGLGIPPIWAFVILNLQVLLCKFVFYKGYEGKFLATTNRNLFNWFALILFFYNGLAGLVSAILRIGLSLVFGLLLLFRLDRVVLMKGFTRLDFGHDSFLSFFYLDYAYNNPVVHVFIKTLTENLPPDNVDKEMDSHVVNPVEKYSSLKGAVTNTSNAYPRQRIRNLWLVGYTLARNPSLVPLVGGNGDDKLTEKSDSDVALSDEKKALGNSKDLNTLIEHAAL